MTAYEYATSPDTGTRHVFAQNGTLQNRRRTACGQDSTGWPGGDETVSGSAATCRRCKTIVRNANREPVR